jgi:hypothetical protein
MNEPFYRPDPDLRTPRDRVLVQKQRRQKEAEEAARRDEVRAARIRHNHAQAQARIDANFRGHEPLVRRTDVHPQALPKPQPLQVERQADLEMRKAVALLVTEKQIATQLAQQNQSRETPEAQSIKGLSVPPPSNQPIPPYVPPGTPERPSDLDVMADCGKYVSWEWVCTPWMPQPICLEQLTNGGYVAFVTSYRTIYEQCRSAAGAWRHRNLM